MLYGRRNVENFVREIWQRTGLTKIKTLRANGARRWGSNPHGGPPDMRTYGYARAFDVT